MRESTKAKLSEYRASVMGKRVGVFNNYDVQIDSGTVVYIVLAAQLLTDAQVFVFFGLTMDQIGYDKASGLNARFDWCILLNDKGQFKRAPIKSIR